MTRPKICVVGSLNMDLVIRTPRFARPGETVMGGPFATYPGGKGANQAVAAARLGGQVAFVGAVGDDAHGAVFQRLLRHEGIDCSHVFSKQGAATGVALIAIDDQKQNSIIVALGANLELSPADIDLAMPVIREADIVMLQLEIPLATIDHLLLRRSEFTATIMLNTAPAQCVPREVLEQMDVLVFNEIEAYGLLTQAHGRMAHDQLLAAVPARGTSVKVLTLAEHGSMTCVQGDHVHEHTAFAVQAVDTVGAGDAFCGALAVALAGAPIADLSHSELNGAIRFASAAGALAVTRQGAIPSLPTRENVDALLRAHRPAHTNGEASAASPIFPGGGGG